MNILSIETASNICGAAFIKNGNCVMIAERACPRTSAEELPGMVNEVQQKSEFKWKELDGVAVSIGPGSFTGLRIGLSFAKGVAFSYSLPIIPVSTLTSIGSGVQPKSKLFRIALFSHRNLFYTQVFHKLNGFPNIENEPILLDWESLNNTIMKENIEVFNCGGDHIISENNNNYFSPAIPSAKWVGIFAHQRYDDLVVATPHRLVPNYIAPFEINKSKNAVS